MTKKLTDILENIKIQKQVGTLDIQINKIEFDSRKVSANDIFVAIRGTLSDGHNFIETAIEKGAKTIVCQDLPLNLNENILYLKVKDTSEVLGLMACNFYENPSENLKLVGITGTNGKTTTVTLLYEMFKRLGYKVGLLSTIKNMIDNQEIAATHTTPDQLQLNKLLSQMVENECEYCFMEVSSHAIAQNRIAGLHFAGGIFSNITHDHLDYHHTFAEYIKAKKRFFDNLPKSAFALTNNDDKNGEIMLQNCNAKHYTYSLKSFSDYNCQILEHHFDGTLLKIDKNETWVHFIGNFNAYNLLAVYATAILLEQEKDEVLTILSDLKPVAGRFNTVNIGEITAIVDYAHTPDALENVLRAILEIKEETQNILTVVGAGGDRDKTKRPIMAKIAAKNSAKVILTSDNPRSETPEDIINDMYKGVENVEFAKVLKITDRKEAIKTACLLANKGDIILIAGKGHENYQEVKGIKTHFDDKEIVTEFLNKLKK